MLKLIHSVSQSIIPLALLSTMFDATYAFLVNTYLFKRVLNSLQQGRELKYIVIEIGVIFLFVIFTTIFNQCYSLFWELKTPILRQTVHKKLEDKALEVELACFESPTFYDTYVKATDEASKRAIDVLNNLCDVLWLIINGIATAALVASISPIFLILPCLPLIATLIVGRKRNKLKFKREMRNKEVNRQKGYVRRTFYLVDYAKEMRLSNIHKVLYHRMHESVAQLIDIAKEYGFKLMWFSYLFGVLFDYIVYGGTVILAAFQTLVKGTLPLGDCFVVINSISMIAWCLNDAGDTFMKLDENSQYIDNLRAFLEYKSKMPEIADAPIAKDHQYLDIQNMSFVYEGQETPVLKNISFSVKKGEKIAIVGHNGAGKTTLVKLLMRLYDPNEGRISLDGRDIREYRLSTYRNLFGTVFQDYRLFSASVADNVLLRAAHEEADRTLIEDSLKKSGIYDKIASLPRGIDTIVTKEFDKEGAVFSGGEAQKISIARIFARDPEIVILDEPSSALDPLAEDEMYRNMFAACDGKTVIFISHRLSSATMADHVYLFEKGEIIEHGTHHELLAMNGKYADMWHKQAEKYSMKEASL